MGNARLWSALEERERLYAKASLTDSDGMRLGELEGIVGDEDGYTAESDAAIRKHLECQIGAERRLMNPAAPAQSALGELKRAVDTLKSVEGGGGAAAARAIDQVHKSLSHCLTESDARYMRAAHPVGAVVVGGVAIGLAPLIIILLVVVLAVVGLAALVIYNHEINAWGQRMILDIVMQSAVKVEQARANVQRYVRENPLPPDCQTKFEIFMTAVAALLRYANMTPTSTNASQGWQRTASGLGRAVEESLRNLMGCIDPQGTTGLLRRFAGPDGLIEKAFNNLRVLFMRP